eukprot:8536081-Heterocapsa_arctica.AAC.1
MPALNSWPPPYASSSMSMALSSCSSAMAPHRMSTPNSPSSLQTLCGSPSGPGAEFLLCLMALA